MSRSRWSCASAVALLALGYSSEAPAYPQYVAKGYSNCGTCHYSPTGGGMANSYGVAASEATVPDRLSIEWLSALRTALAKSDVTGSGADGKPALHWDFGVDLRLLALRSPLAEEAEPSWIAIPMLAEVSGVLAYGSVSGYAALAARPGSREREELSILSREHWLALRLGDSDTLRAGRMVLPYGLRLPDHTAYTRGQLGFDKYGQSYAAAWDRAGEESMLSAAAFVGDLTHQPRRLQERGVALSGALNVASRGTFGLSLLAAHSVAARRLAAGPFVRSRLLGATYALGELSGVYRWSAAAAQSSAVGLLRLGWFPIESLDLYLETAGVLVRDAWKLTKLRYAAGAGWQLLPWIELAPAVVLEEKVESGLDTSAMVQLHLIY